MPLATSKKLEVVNSFLAKIPSAQGRDCVLFTFIFHGDITPPCIHVNYLENISGVLGEEEFLFVAYSAFEVQEVRMSQHPTWMQPHEVVVNVIPDNRLVPVDLPLSTW